MPYVFRFCGISNSFARRNAEGTSFFTAGHQLNGSRASGPSSKSNVAIDVKGEAGVSADLHLVSKPPVDKGKVAPAPADKKGGQNSKNTAGAGGSSGNPWSHASAKSKDPKPIGGLAGTVSHDSSGWFKIWILHLLFAFVLLLLLHNQLFYFVFLFICMTNFLNS